VAVVEVAVVEVAVVEVAVEVVDLLRAAQPLVPCGVFAYDLAVPDWDWAPPLVVLIQ